MVVAKLPLYELADKYALYADADIDDEIVFISVCVYMFEFEPTILIVPATVNPPAPSHTK